MAKGGASQEHPPVLASTADYEEAIRKIRGVMAARVVADGKGSVNEIHVLAGPERAPKQVVRDVESSLMAQFGLAVDHKRISVAQVENSEPITWGNGRLQLVNVRFSVDSVRAEAEVEVRFSEVLKIGRAAGPSSSVNRLRVTARATLAALGEYFSPDYRISLDDVVVTRLRDKNVVLTSLSLLSPNGEETLIGSSLVRGSEPLAVARSVLDAMNRRFMIVVGKGEPGGSGNGPVPAEAGDD